MSFRELKAKLWQWAPPWGLSLALHVGILVAAGFITWHAVRPPPKGEAVVLRVAGAALPGAAETGAPAVPGSPLAEALPIQEAKVPRVMPAPPAPEALEMALMTAALPAAPPVAAAPESADPVRELATILAASTTPLATGRVPEMGLLDGTSAGFGQHIGDLRGTGLEVVLVLDATDSMGPYIEQARKRLRQVLDVVTGLVPNARIGVVAYKDYGDDYGPEACKLLPLTSDAKAVRTFIDGIKAGGGGDIPEPINEAVRIATSEKMTWDRRKKHVIILVGDSPCHPSGRKDAAALAAAFAKQGGTLSAIDVGGAGDPAAQRNAVQPDLDDIAKRGGGEAFLLKNTDAFWRHLIVSIFGRRFEQDVDTIIRRIVPEE